MTSGGATTGPLASRNLKVVRRKCFSTSLADFIYIVLFLSNFVQLLNCLLKNAIFWLNCYLAFCHSGLVFFGTKRC